MSQSERQGSEGGHVTCEAVARVARSAEWLSAARRVQRAVKPAWQGVGYQRRRRLPDFDGSGCLLPGSVRRRSRSGGLNI